MSKTEGENQGITLGLHHLGLTVSNLSSSVSFFIDQLGYKKVGEKPDYPAAFVSDGHTMLTLWQAKDADNASNFDRHNNVGLHHFAIAVPGIEALEKLHEKLKSAGVDIEFAPELVKSSGAHHMMCYIPGGPRLELIAPKVA